MAAAGPPLAVDDEAGEPETAEELLKEAEKVFGEIFSVRPPRDLIAGIWSGGQCLLTGLFMGLAGGVMQPIESARAGGVLGCFSGVAGGLLTAVFFSVTGVCTAAFQVLRGAWATPRALTMRCRGWEWSQARADWAEPVPYSLLEEATRVFGPEGPGEDENSDDEGGGGRRAVDSFYYDQLGLKPSASQRDIRRAYFLQSRQWHPDKCRDAGAKERFQAISEAYQVLSDPERRRSYDAAGRAGVGDGFVDAGIFFSVLLGANALEPYVGRLRLAEMFGDAIFGDTADVQVDEEEAARKAERSERRQLRRQVRLAVALAARLDARGDADDAAFRAAALDEGRRLLEADVTVLRLLTDIGWLYRNRAEVFLARSSSRLGAFGWQALSLHFGRSWRELSQKARTANLAVRALWKLRAIVNEADELQEAVAQEDAQVPGSISSALPTFLETFLSLTAHDITATLDKVAGRVLGDAVAGSETCRRRAAALRLLGEAFLEATAGAGRGDHQGWKRFEDALVASMGSGAAAAASSRGED